MDLSLVGSKAKLSNLDEEYSVLQEIAFEQDLFSKDIFYLKQFLEVAERHLQRKVPLKTLRISISQEPGSHDEMSYSHMSSSMSTISRTTSSRRTYPTLMGVTRINTKTKVTMADYEIDENKKAIEKLRRRFNSDYFLFKCEEENFGEQLKEIEAMKSLLSTLVAENNKGIPYDKFHKFLTSELGNGSFKWNKIRTQKKQLEIEFNRIKTQQQSKLELQDRLQSIDIEKLSIEYHKHQDILEQKTNYLNDLKKRVVRKGQMVISLKSKIHNAIAALTNIRKENIEKEEKIALIKRKEKEDVSKLESAEFLYSNTKTLDTNCKGAGVTQYMMTETALSKAKKEKEYLEKRLFDAKQTIACLERQEKKIMSADSSTKSLKKAKSAKVLLKRGRKLSCMSQSLLE